MTTKKLKMVVPSPVQVQQLFSAIREIINWSNTLIDETGNRSAIITDARRIDQMTNSLGLSVMRRTKKYLLGQLEHGGDITDRDLLRELQSELDDAFWYNEAEQWKRDGYKPPQYIVG